LQKRITRKDFEKNILKRITFSGIYSEYSLGGSLGHEAERDWTEEELAHLERKHSDGITSAELIGVVNARGFKFSESTLRKYVQLGLLPRSRRVGRKGLRRGSVGMYPPQIISHIAAIKRGLNDNRTLDEIRYRASVLAELESLSTSFNSVAESMRALVGNQKDGKVRERVTAQLEGATKDFDKLRKRLSTAIGELV